MVVYLPLKLLRETREDDTILSRLFNFTLA